MAVVSKATTSGAAIACSWASVSAATCVESSAAICADVSVAVSVVDVVVVDEWLKCS
jgi:hypothetical protein